jgi:muramoyltetrapeptide carboxypeptidase
MLKQYAHIAVVAPAGIPNLDGVEAGIALVESWGYRVTRAPHIADKHHFTAGTTDVRTRDLIWALSAEGIDAVWLARGGYGCMQCLPHLPRDLSTRWAITRPVIGCSDATALLTYLDKRRGGPLVHGPMIETIATRVDDATRSHIRAMLAGESIAPIPVQHFAGPSHAVRGRFVGGNLCVLASLAGTPSALDSKDAIVVLEDITEAPYRIDRLITQLKQSGALDGALAIALGDFVKCEPPAGAGYTLHDVLREVLAPLGVPVWSGLPTGHAARNLAWRVGAIGELGNDAFVQNNATFAA